MWKKIFGSAPKPEMAAANPLYEKIDKTRLPRHVAVIMDGNGRWAKGKGLMRTAGHKAGVDALKQILKVAIDLEIEALTVYAFSTENWKRPHEEVDFLMKLFSEYLAREVKEMHEDHVQIHFIGRVRELSPGLQKQVAEAEHLMKDNTGVKFYVAVNYGGQDELTRAMQSIAAEVKAGTLEPEAIEPACIEQHLDTAGVPPVDLMIRTSGDLRVSNFLLWQAAYAEFWFTQTNWPDFTPACFVDALLDFAKRERRFGGLKNKGK